MIKSANLLSNNASQNTWSRFKPHVETLGLLGTTADSLTFNLQKKTFGLTLNTITLREKRGCLSEILKRTQMGYQDPVLWTWLEIFNTLSHVIYFLRHYTLKGTSKPFEV